MQARLQILGVHTHKMPQRGVDLHQLASDMEGYTGADIENLCREVSNYTKKEVWKKMQKMILVQNIYIWGMWRVKQQNEKV